MDNLSQEQIMKMLMKSARGSGSGGALIGGAGKLRSGSKVGHGAGLIGGIRGRSKGQHPDDVFDKRIQVREIVEQNKADRAAALKAARDSVPKTDTKNIESAIREIDPEAADKYRKLVDASGSIAAKQASRQSNAWKKWFREHLEEKEKWTTNYIKYAMIEYSMYLARMRRYKLTDKEIMENMESLLREFYNMDPKDIRRFDVTRFPISMSAATRAAHEKKLVELKEKRHAKNPPKDKTKAKAPQSKSKSKSEGVSLAQAQRELLADPTSASVYKSYKPKGPYIDEMEEKHQ